MATRAVRRRARRQRQARREQRQRQRQQLSRERSQPSQQKTPCGKHRAAQARYVAKSPAAQRRRVRATYRKNSTKIKAEKRAARRSGGTQGGKVGRPRTC